MESVVLNRNKKKPKINIKFVGSILLLDVGFISPYNVKRIYFFKKIKIIIERKKMNIQLKKC